METRDAKAIYKDYCDQKKGRLYKSVNFSFETEEYVYDIYWADPKIVFYNADAKLMPIACLTYPLGTLVSNARIYLHEKLTEEYEDIFEYIIMHEIGHSWFYDFMGIRSGFDNHEFEALADLFATIFFMKFRNFADLDQVNTLINNIITLQAKLYNIPLNNISQFYNTKKFEIELLVAKSKASMLSDDHYVFNMTNSIEPALDALGDIFR